MFIFFMQQVLDLLVINKSELDIQVKVVFIKVCRVENNFLLFLQIGFYFVFLQDWVIDVVEFFFNEVIFIIYFSLYFDFQCYVFVENNVYDYIKFFYDSVNQLGLVCIIFYDNLSVDFVEQYLMEKI